MKTTSNLTGTEFASLIPDQELNILKIIQLALMAGVGLFGGITFFFYQQNPGLTPTESDLSLLQTLTFAHIFMGISLFAASTIVPNKLFISKSQATLENLSSGVNESKIEPIVQAYKISHIVRLALREGVAFFGLVVCFLGVQNGALHAEPFYLINIISAVIFIILGLISIPNRENIALHFDNLTSGF